MNTATITAAVAFAFAAAYDLIEEDQLVVEALNCIEDKEPEMIVGGWYVCPYAHLGNVADKALKAAELCAKARLYVLETRMRAIDARLRAVCSRGRKDVGPARIDLIRLTAEAKSALSMVEM